MFTPADFLDLGSRDPVATALKRHRAAGTIRRIARGLYDVRQYHAKPAVSYPSVQAVIDSLGRRDSVRLQPTGAYAANLLGLSEQVPLRVVSPRREPRMARHYYDLLCLSTKGVAKEAVDDRGLFERVVTHLDEAGMRELGLL